MSLHFPKHRHAPQGTRFLGWSGATELSETRRDHAIVRFSPPQPTPGDRLIRSASISRCSRFPSYRPRSGSTSFVPLAPTPVEVAAAGPMAGAVPRAPTRPGRTDLPGVASRGIDASPSPRRCPSPGSKGRPGTSGRWVWGPGPPVRRCRRPGRERKAPTRRPPPRLQTTAPPVLPSPCTKNFPEPISGQVLIRISFARLSSR